MTITFTRPGLAFMRCTAFCCILVFVLAPASARADVSDAPGHTPPDVLADWKAQDRVGVERSWEQATESVVEELGTERKAFAADLQTLSKDDPNDAGWAALYERACAKRRALRLSTLLATAPRIAFIRRHDFQSSFYAYTEGQSDAQNERCFIPDAALCVLSFDGLYGSVETLLHDPAGVIRDPDASWDGRRILFSWKKSLDGDDYHLYEMEPARRKIRQLTDGLGFADYEGVYAPNGDIIFNSTRCVQTVDCWWTEVSNLYTCDGDGRFLRRLTFDQVHNNFPAITPDGRVIYTRWDYSDRGQIFPQGLFQMYPDGTGQTELYGNNSYFPTTIAHARPIPGSGKYVAVFIGHHTLQKGWLGILDPAKGRQENEGAQLIAPVRETEAVRIDDYGQSGDQFQYPYPISETEFIVAFKPAGSQAPFALYWVDLDGRRELLAASPEISCVQPVPLAARPVPHIKPAEVDYRKSEGVYYMQDIYEGPGLIGVPRGTVKKLRVVALDFRAAGMGHNCSNGEAGQALVCTPISIGNGSWDVKSVLGEATVQDDGSAMFAVPARLPVYFQAVDDRGYVVQTMRSWSTLQPGENMSCIGCHESKNTAPPANRTFTAAMKAGVEKLDGFYGRPRGFSFRNEIQPILDEHCVRCHDVEEPMRWGAPADARPGTATTGRTAPPSSEGPPPVEHAFSLRGTEVVDTTARRRWSKSYLALTHATPQDAYDCAGVLAGQPNELLNWVHAQSGPTLQPPYSAGAAKSRLMQLIEAKHGGVELTREQSDKIACWIDLLVPYCGDYVEANAWTEEERNRYEHFQAKRRRMQEQEDRNIREWIKSRQ